MHTTNQPKAPKVGKAVKKCRPMVKPTARPRHTLDELLAQCDDSAEVSAKDREWLDAHPIGGELS